MLAVIEIAVLVIMAVAAARASSRLLRSRALFAEFGASLAPAYLAWLYPLAPLCFLLLTRQLGFLPAALPALLCYVAGLAAVRRARGIFERAGTDRVRQIQDDLALLFICGLGGVVYVCLIVGLQSLLATSAPLDA